MTRPDGPDAAEAADAADKAAWAGADAEQTVDAEVLEAEVVDDGTAAEDAGEPAAEAGSDAATELQAQLDERTSDLQRLSAEFANYRRRVERDRQATIDAAKASVLAELLPITDDLERAREHGDLEEGPLKVFADKVRSLLAAQGVEAFGEEGDAFDPSMHEAVQDESEGSDPVLGAVLRKGYRYGERTLRTAMVVVR
ncbi:MAG TPA: nucleotide exchange factor GrpE [Candidatus Dietzia intestinipullorum]|nr:nucleotide exchange factor GrpE [Candidatus Dietzia intestinipullorum]